MVYVWIAVAIIILFLIGRIVRWWNLPAVEKARAEKVKTRQENRTERQKNRRWLFRRRFNNSKET